MGELIYADFKTKSRHYTKGGGLDDLVVLANAVFVEAFPVDVNHYHRDTAPAEYTAPEQDPA
ncbi:hypothetical protein AYJ54_00645 [Bradyrhizobium centrolobii]|uniref:Uncharacterized protein n=1 Tax=Bradyrhizobium centrolobii TaxID=1505087 RepID=A0A176YGL6_9BRAD|nr:hypothetical protein [Bradyrhizobium centrolobii]OAF05447.1 hypothetical protein AYJ54_00645 [Bradyrhizobium centrolobii]